MKPHEFIYIALELITVIVITTLVFMVVVPLSAAEELPSCSVYHSQAREVYSLHGYQTLQQAGCIIYRF